MPNIQPSLDQAEHIGPLATGDNIEAKRVAGYTWNGTTWVRPPTPFADAAYDDIEFSNADGGGNYQTITYKANGVTVRTNTLAYDANNNVTSIIRS